MHSKNDNGMMDLRVKYRPKKFHDMAQGLSDPTIRAITMAFGQDRKLQALLLQGPYGSGKTSIARIIGQRNSCLEKAIHAYEPCGTCEHCIGIQHDPRAACWHGYSEFDVQTAPPSELISKIRRGSLYSGPRRTVALDEFHRLRLQDQERFVKVIEDLSADRGILFVLCVAADAKLCRAIAQRCSRRRITLPSLERAGLHIQAVAQAEGEVVSTDDASLIADMAQCVPRDYIGILQDAFIISDGSAALSQAAIHEACASSSQIPSTSTSG